MTDWTDETLRPLDELARIAFPEGSGVTADTLKRLARAGKLVVYRPGKQHLSTLVNVWEMVRATRVGPKPPTTKKRSPSAPNALGLTELELSNLALEQAREALRRREEKRIEDEWEARYERRKAAERKARPPRTPKSP
ncbi:hypothetical protein [Bradyrhizobium arachidis]|uniref:Uncharacterized protein n=1 Tax=Bradyrhizobium arachidis TaxID=858423 RepID=A0AAE7NTD1_9BRAD|nr:hypothetical protein [Bradyrhizobium arachidis]QOZ69198.1 hypothetical protein WN72_24895 [Bradyrhizobium arachidis]